MRYLYLTETVAPLYRAAVTYGTEAAYLKLAREVARGKVRLCEWSIVKKAAFWEENEYG